MADNITVYKQLKYHQIMIGRLKIWLLDALIGLFGALLGILIARHHQNLVIILGVVAGVLGMFALVVSYGIYKGQQKFNNILECRQKAED